MISRDVDQSMRRLHAVLDAEGVSQRAAGAAIEAMFGAFGPLTDAEIIEALAILLSGTCLGRGCGEPQEIDTASARVDRLARLMLAAQMPPAEGRT